MRFRRLVFSAVALGGAGLSVGCTDEARGVIEPPYTSNGGSTTSSGGTTGTGGKGGAASSQGGKKPTSGGTGNVDTGGTGNVDTMGGGGPDVVGDCELPWSQGTTGSDDSCDLESLSDGGVKLEGDISSDLTLPGGKSYVLSGEVRVLGGAVLTLAPCTKIIGEDKNALLVVMPGAKIEAVGEQDAPIVFTSSKPPGQRAPGDWGGLMLLGNARSNQATDISRPVTEGLVQAEPYGSDNDDHNDESSGSLVYVRLEFVGKQAVALNSEVNGVTFYAVGSGTKVSHVQVANCTDDCFEWFGGTVNADHLIALNCDDDQFDTDNAFRGNVQFVFGRQFPTTAEADSNGFEMDTAKDKNRVVNDVNLGPYLETTARWSNVTLCGEGPSDALSPPRFGAVLRKFVAGGIENAIFTGFADGGISLRDGSPITVKHSLVFNNGADGTTTLDPAQPWDQFSAAEWSNGTDAPPGFCDCWANPPVPFSPEPVPGSTPEGFVDAGANYVGAFRQADVASNWMIGKWVSWDQE